MHVRGRRSPPTLGRVEDRPIRPYVPAPVAVADWDPRSPDVAAHLTALIEAAAPGHVVEHVGSSAVPGLIGKGIIDLVVPAEPEEIPAIRATSAVRARRYPTRPNSSVAASAMLASFPADGVRTTGSP